MCTYNNPKQRAGRIRKCLYKKKLVERSQTSYAYYIPIIPIIPIILLISIKICTTRADAILYYINIIEMV